MFPVVILSRRERIALIDTTKIDPIQWVEYPLRVLGFSSPYLTVEKNTSGAESERCLLGFSVATFFKEIGGFLCGG